MNIKKLLSLSVVTLILSMSVSSDVDTTSSIRGSVNASGDSFRSFKSKLLKELPKSVPPGSLVKTNLFFYLV